MDTLDEQDMATLARLNAQGEGVRAWEQRAIEARLELRGAEKFFFASIMGKYEMTPSDSVAQDGSIVRKPHLEGQEK